MKEKFKNILCADDSTVYAEYVRRNVGADYSVCPLPQRNTLKKQTGITLIALIISIIVILILAAVSINIMQNQGIIDKTKKAAEKHNQKAEEEKENLTSWEQLIGQYDGTDTTVPQELKSYLLGKDLAIIMDIENMTFKDDPNTISDASTSVIFESFFPTGSAIEEKMYIYVRYKEKNYRVKCILGDDETILVSELLQKSILNGREGKNVQYKGKEYTVLYDNGETVEIILNETVGEYTIGFEDINEIGNNNWEKAINSYNKAIERLNAYCASFYEGDSNIISVRSVGSDPTNPNNENGTLYTDDVIVNWKCKYNDMLVNVDRIVKSEDENYVFDIEKLSDLGKLQLQEDYWLASRTLKVYDEDATCRIIYFPAEGEYCEKEAIVGFGDYENEGSNKRTYVDSISHQVRPVVKINASALNFN